MAFEWMNCQFFLKRRHAQNEITINLTSYHQLQVTDRVPVTSLRTKWLKT